MKNNAFTLAETLITIIIVGIVSAITIPTMISKYQKEQVVVKLKQNYSILYNAYKKSVSDNGSAEFWDYNLANKDFYSLYLAPYLKGEICTTNTGKCKSYKRRSCISSSCQYSYTFTPDAILNNGAYLSFAKDNGFVIRLDINGSKKPNTYGKDIFGIAIQNRSNTKSCKFYERFGFSCQWCGACQQAGTSSTKKTRANWLNTCHKDNGPSCGGLIEYDGWKISDDYPW